MYDMLLTPYALTTRLLLKNRIVMPPMTRRCAEVDHTPSEEMIEYYARRAEAGLLITEGTLIDKDAIGYGNVPGIYTQKHIDAWSKITSAVHSNNGIIFAQLWHCGRISHVNFHNGIQPISASATQANIILGKTNLKCSKARAASTAEIEQLILSFQTAAKLSISAGFDGIEIHAANGYLIDQFLHHCTNHRLDEYGGSPKNMARFALEIVHACGKAIGYDRIAIRLSPAGYMNEINRDNRDKLVYMYLLNQLSNLNIAYVHTGSFDDTIIYTELNNKSMTEFIRSLYRGTLIASGSYSINAAFNGIKQKMFDLIAIGRLHIANHDLIFKIKNKKHLIPYEQKMLFTKLY